MRVGGVIVKGRYSFEKLLFFLVFVAPDKLAASQSLHFFSLFVKLLNEFHLYSTLLFLLPPSLSLSAMTVSVCVCLNFAI